jgi:hypothetical protein
VYGDAPVEVERGGALLGEMQGLGDHPLQAGPPELPPLPVD